MKATSARIALRLDPCHCGGDHHGCRAGPRRYGRPSLRIAATIADSISLVRSPLEGVLRRF